MSARDELRRYVHLLADAWTPCETTDARVEKLYGLVRAEVLAEAKAETVAWLVKKASERNMQDAAVLASKLDRGAVRIFIGTDYYRGAMDEHRAEVLAEAAAVVDATLTEEPDTMRASALYEALLKLRAMPPCTCARSWGLHGKACRKYVAGHELLSPANALAAYRAETDAR
ncbi:hypothetical protein [Streptomyces sp. NBRC 110035]|uniref:hypothetical protein n=1 Tax=Streptomyces sp. NBRC 110035 TaxID=1547867 RepID=UPI0005A60091|nr:hypothetical protein [Streptomyces sp. NBRC 110035]